MVSFADKQHLLNISLKLCLTHTSREERCLCGPRESPLTISWNHKWKRCRSIWNQSLF